MTPAQWASIRKGKNMAYALSMRADDLLTRPQPVRDDVFRENVREMQRLIRSIGEIFGMAEAPYPAALPAVVPGTPAESAGEPSGAHPAIGAGGGAFHYQEALRRPYGVPAALSSRFPVGSRWIRTTSGRVDPTVFHEITMISINEITGDAAIIYAPGRYGRNGAADTLDREAAHHLPPETFAALFRRDIP